MGSDIFDALYGVRVAFQAANLSPPAAIVLATHEDGMRLLSAINTAGVIYTAPSPHYKPEAMFCGRQIPMPPYGKELRPRYRYEVRR